MPSVVNISTTQTVVTNINPFPFEFPPGSPYEDLFKEFGTPQKRKASALGSGFIIDSKGIVITNNHVIKGAEDIVVRVNGDKEYKVKVIMPRVKIIIGRNNDFKDEEGNRIARIYDIIEDKEQNIWIASLGYGLFKYNLDKKIFEEMRVGANFEKVFPPPITKQRLCLIFLNIISGESDLLTTIICLPDNPFGIVL